MYTPLSKIGRWLLFMVAIMMVSSPLATQAKGGYSFWSENGSVVLSDVRLALWGPGDGDYVVKLTIVPTQAEIDALLRKGSHVDFEFRLLGLERTGGRVDFAIGASDYVRYVGAVVDSSSSDPVFRALGLNIEKRWIANEAITITASIYGYQPSSEFRPRVSVDLISSTWWFAEGGCRVAYEREKNNITEQYCTERGEQFTLVDPYGDVRFPF